MPVKDPSAVLDYGFDWSQWLVDDDTISASEWTAPVGLTVDSSTHDATTTTVWLSEGVVGETYQVTNRITTLGGRVDDRTIKISIRQL